MDKNKIMFELNGEQYSLEQVQEAAKQSNLSLDNYIAKYGITKEYGITKLDIEDFLVTIDDLKDSETNVVTNLNNKLSRIGLVSSETTNIGSTDAIKITKQDEPQPTGYGTPGYGTPSFGSTLLFELLISSKVGADKSEEELKKSVNSLNRYIRNNANFNYTKEAKNKFGEKYKKEFLPYVEPEDLSDQELQLSLIHI